MEIHGIAENDFTTFHSEGYELSSNVYNKQEELNLRSEMGNFEYMPQTFHGLKTSDFGMITQRYDSSGCRLETVSIHPFLKLKDIAMDSSIDAIDRMQSVRYMCFIPHSNGEEHCIEAAKCIVLDDQIDIYRRYYFFSNNEKYFKLIDAIVHALHEVFFEEGHRRGYPFELLIRSARYILSFYGTETNIRQTVLDWIVDVGDDANEQHTIRAECADVLITCGEPDEVEYGRQIIGIIGVKKDFYSSEENIHSETLTESAKGVIRALHTDASLQSIVVSIDEIYHDILKYADSFEDKESIQSYIHRIQTDPTRFLRLTLYDIFVLVAKKMKQFSVKNPGAKGALEIRLFQEMIEASHTCASGYLIRMLNVLQGFVEEKPLQLRMSVKDEIRSVVFARINTALRGAANKYQEQILESIESENKDIVTDFIDMLDLREELWDEYESLVEEEQFDTIVSECINQYIGKEEV